MSGLREVDDQLADLYDAIVAGMSCEELRTRVQHLLSSLTHDDKQGRIDQFGQKLLFPRWRVDFLTYGEVFSALFGDIREDGICQRLYQLFVELVRLECEPQSHKSEDSGVSRVQGALHRYLTIRGYGRAAYPGLPDFVPFSVEGAPPSGLGYVLSGNGKEFTEHLLGTTLTFDENDVRDNLDGRTVENLFSELGASTQTLDTDSEETQQKNESAGSDSESPKGQRSSRGESKSDGEKPRQNRSSGGGKVFSHSRELITKILKDHHLSDGRIANPEPLALREIVRRLKAQSKGATPYQVEKYFKDEFPSQGGRESGWSLYAEAFAQSGAEETLLKWFRSLDRKGLAAALAVSELQPKTFEPDSPADGTDSQLICECGSTMTQEDANHWGECKSCWQSHG